MFVHFPIMAAPNLPFANYNRQPPERRINVGNGRRSAIGDILKTAFSDDDDERETTRELEELLDMIN
ncbi:MAG: hypothetical protein HKN78_00830 [Sphingomonadaceae bacterium]|nr:hypothetical protein [Sphingomonadaceae bacterium]